MHARTAQRGQVLVIFALAFVTLILVVGLVIDGSFAWAKRREAQNAADFASLAGARIVRLAQTQPAVGLTNSDVAQAIIDAATANHEASVSGFGTSNGPQYTDGSGNPIGMAIGPVSDHSAIPPRAAGVQISQAELTWRPFVGGIIGIQNWTAGAQATARFVQGDDAPPCSLCVLGGLSGSSSGNIEADGAILVGGSGSASSSVNLTSHNGSIVVSSSSSSTSSARITAPNGSVYVDGNFTGSSSNKISAPNGSVYVSGSITLSSSGDITAGGSVLAGGNITMSSSSRITAGGTVAAAGNMGLSSSARISGAAIQYVGNYPSAGGFSCISSCSVSPSATQVGSVTVPAVPAVEDPYETIFDDATTAKVQEYYPSYPGGLATVSRTIAASSSGTIRPSATELVQATVSSSASGTLNPGIYKWLRCSSSSTCTLNPGTYYFDGNASALDLSSSSRLRTNGPVTLVFLNQSGLKMTSSTSVALEAPATSTVASAGYPWPGVAIFFARANTSTIQMSSSSGNAVTGIIYAPAATLELSSSTNQTIESTVVVGTFKGSSSSTLIVGPYDAIGASEPGQVQLVR